MTIDRDFTFVERRQDLRPSRPAFQLTIDSEDEGNPVVNVVGQYAEDMSPDECRRLAAALIEAADAVERLALR